MRDSSRLTVDGLRPSRAAIVRIDSPAVRPRPISSRSANDRQRPFKSRPRRGRTPPATVIGTASAHNHGYVRELGAADMIDYHEGGWTAAVQALVPGGADAVLEAYGGRTKLQAPRALRDGGRIVWITGDPPPQLDRGIVGANVHGLPRRDTLEALADLTDRGQLQLPVQQVYELGDAAAAQERVADGHVRGKLVIEIPLKD